MDITAVLLLLVGLAIGALVAAGLRPGREPSYDASVADTLGRLDAQLREMEGARERAYGGLLTSLGHVRETSEAVRAETASLVTALRAPHTRGRWGEMQLRRVIEAAGAIEHCDFVEQATVRGDDGALRPDVVVRLAGDKQVVIDAKVPFAAYLEATEARDEQTRAERMRAHARQLREHVRALAAKEYWSAFDTTPEFVVLFVPGDAFLDAALREDPGLQETAFAANVVLATPSTLVALLRTIAYTWRQDALTANAREVSLLGRELHLRLAKMGSHLDHLGKALSGAVGSYNETVGSLESRVLVTARRFGQLGVTDDDLGSPRQVEQAPRVLSAAELLDDAAAQPPVRLAADGR